MCPATDVAARQRSVTALSRCRTTARVERLALTGKTHRRYNQKTRNFKGKYTLFDCAESSYSTFSCKSATTTTKVESDMSLRVYRSETVRAWIVVATLAQAIPAAVAADLGGPQVRSASAVPDSSAPAIGRHF
jgi:hypothetical protein